MKRDSGLWSWLFAAGLLLTVWGQAWADPTTLSNRVILQATTIAGQINGLHTCTCGASCRWPNGTSGAIAGHGYCGDAYNDCYGFVRRVWNPFLAGMTAACRKTAGMGTRTALPVADAPDSLWAKITDPTMLIPGDVLATAQGHAWGEWHGGLFAGGATSKGFYYYFDDEPSRATSAIKRSTTWWNGFHYYYKPTHYLLQYNLCP